MGDMLKAEMRKEAAKKLMEEVSESNSQMMKLKELKRQKERDEDQRIAQYLQDKAAREQAHQEALDRAAAEREAECAALRAAQEKESDKKSELDALRAKRATEQAERDWRQKERASIQKQQSQNKMLSEARTQQKKEKERRLKRWQSLRGKSLTASSRCSEMLQQWRRRKRCKRTRQR